MPPPNKYFNEKQEMKLYSFINLLQWQCILHVNGKNKDFSQQKNRFYTFSLRDAIQKNTGYFMTLCKIHLTPTRPT